MKLIFTKELPDKPGYYWWTNFGENTPCILRVEKDYTSGRFYAQNGEYDFYIDPPPSQLELPLKIKDEDIREQDGHDKYQYGDDLWCYIPSPYLPRGNKQISPNSY